MGTTVHLKTSSSGVWLGPLVGCEFKTWMGLIQCVQTIVLTLVNLTSMRLSTSNLQQKKSLEARNGLNLYSPRRGKHLNAKIKNVSLLEKKGLTPRASKMFW